MYLGRVILTVSPSVRELDKTAATLRFGVFDDNLVTPQSAGAESMSHRSAQAKSRGFPTDESTPDAMTPEPGTGRSSGFSGLWFSSCAL